MKSSFALCSLALGASLAWAQPTQGDYLEDEEQVSVGGDIGVLTEGVDGILCLFAKAIPTEMVNKSYLATVDTAGCGVGGVRTEASVGVETTRAAGAPQRSRGHVELPQDSNSDPVVVYYHIEAVSGPSEAEPNGNVVIRYTAKAGESTTLRAQLSADGNNLDMATAGVDGTGVFSFRLAVRGTARDAGRGVVEVYSSAGQAGQSALSSFAFDPDRFCTQLEGQPEARCFERAQAQAMSENQYALYDDGTGARYRPPNAQLRVRRDVEGAWYGYATHRQVSLPGGVATGNQVVSEAGTRYTVKQPPGSLIRFERKRSPLDGIAGQDILVHIPPDVDPTPVRWDAGSKVFVRVDGEPILPGSPLDPGQPGLVPAMLGAERIELDLLNPDPLGPFWVVRTTAILVGPEEPQPLDLTCFSGCPSAALIASAAQDGSDPWAVGPTPYSWNPAERAVFDATNALLDAGPLASQSQFADSVARETGMLMRNSDIQLLQVQDVCTSAPGGQCEGYQLESRVGQYYRYVLFVDPVARPSFLVDSGGAFLDFPPAQTAVFAVPPDPSVYGDEFAGKMVELSVDAFGGLAGIPQACFDTRTFTRSACDSGDGSTFAAAAFTIPAGGYVEVGGQRKWVRALDRSLRLRPVDPAATGSTLPDGLSRDDLPAAFDLTQTGIVAGGPDDPSDPSSNYYAGELSEALFQAAPAVIDGVVVNESAAIDIEP